jgi:CarboxypepD_reg-like domain
MKQVFSIFFLLVLFQLNAKAQSEIKGQVLDQVTKKGLEKAEVLNTTNQSSTLTDINGNFKINAKVGDVMVYRLLGFDTDTALLINLKEVKRFLRPQSNTLNTVSISGQVDPKTQYADVYNKANPVLLTPGRGLRFYPSSFLGKEGKHARRLKKLIETDQVEKEIDKRFNAVTVTALLPINQPELDAFLVLYRPDIKFAVNADADDFRFYLLEAYEKFKALPADQKTLPKLQN